MQKKSLFLFDLDGTLVDSAPDICSAVNRVFADDGLKSLPYAALKAMIGDGHVVLMKKAYLAHSITLDDVQVAGKLALFKEHYQRHILDQTTLINGAMEALARIKEAGHQAVMVTNKAENFSKLISDRLGFTPYLSHIIANEMGIKAKPAPDMIYHALNLCGVAAVNTVMIGDADNDEMAALNAGVDFVLVENGYTKKSPQEFKAILRLPDLSALIPHIL